MATNDQPVGHRAEVPALTPAIVPARTGGGVPPAHDPTPVERLLTVLRRRKWWVVEATVLVPLLVFAFSLTQEKKYTATSSLWFTSSTSSSVNQNADTDPTRVAATNNALVVQPGVAENAAKLAGHGVTAGDVLGAISVAPASDSDIVDINATSTDPQLAARIANAYGSGYIAFRKALDLSAIEKAIKSAQTAVDKMTDTQRASVGGLQLQTQLYQLQVEKGLVDGGAKLIAKAGVPTSPSSPKTKRNIILGILLGLGLGVALAFLRDRLDQSLRTPEELERIYGVPLLASVPRSRVLSGRSGRPLGDGDASALEEEVFRTLRTNLRYFNVTRNIDSLLVSSPTSGDGKSTVALQLAMTMAAMGDSVVFVEADLHKPSSLRVAMGHARAGLSSVLAGASLKDALVSVPVVSQNGAGAAGGRRLTVLPAGPKPPNPLELLESDRMVAVLAELKDRYDRVIVDSPALTGVSDGRALVGQVSGVLAVSAVNHTRRVDADDFRKEIELLGGNLLGVVANFTEVKRSAYDYAYGT